MRTALAAAALLLALPAPVPGQDKKEEKKINVDFTVGWENCYRPMEWTPVLVGISTPFKKPMDCVIRLSAPQNDLNRLDIARREVLMPGRPKEIPLVTKLAFAVNECDVSIHSRESGFYWGQSYELWSGPRGQNRLKEVRPNDLLIGVSGKQGFGVMQVGRASACRTSGNQSGKVFVAFKFQRVLPADWAGFASLDLLVLYDPDWTQLSRHQSRAILDYVTNGGRVLMVLGAHPLPEKHPLAEALPYRIGEPREVEVPYRTLRDWGVQPDDRNPRKVNCWSLVERAKAPGWQTTDAGFATKAQAWGPVGFGRVGVLAFDPSVLGGRQDRSVAQFWVDRMGPLLGARQIQRANDTQDNEDRWSFPVGPAQRGSNAVLEYLYAMEELRPIHIGWVVLVLAALAVIIGPVDYLVLKALGRLPLTWVTASACIALFSIGAYYGVQYLRGGVLQARVITVIDGVSGSPGAAWSTRYLGIFSPRSAEYQLTGLDRGQWWSGMAPTEESIYSFREKLGSRNLYCEQHIDGGNVLTGVPINIWAMQCLSAEAPAAGVPFRATVRPDGSGGFAVEVENLSETPIKSGYVLVGREQCVPFGAVPAKARGSFTGRPQRWENWQSSVDRVVSRDDTAATEARRRKDRTVMMAAGTRRRSEAILDYLKPSDDSAPAAAVVCVEYDGAPVPLGFEGRTCRFEHTMLARLVVFPEGR